MAGFYMELGRGIMTSLEEGAQMTTDDEFFQRYAVKLVKLARLHL